MNIEQRDLLLVPFPFSDQSGMKVRPVMVISNNSFNKTSEDLIVIGVTSNISKDIYSVQLDNSSLEEGKLFDACCAKAENILKIDRQLVIKKIGKIKYKVFNDIVNLLNSILKA